jgi:hypothetical protein
MEGRRWRTAWTLRSSVVAGSGRYIPWSTPEPGCRRHAVRICAPTGCLEGVSSSALAWASQAAALGSVLLSDPQTLRVLVSTGHVAGAEVRNLWLDRSGTSFRWPPRPKSSPAPATLMTSLEDRYRGPARAGLTYALGGRSGRNFCPPSGHEVPKR